MHIFQELKTLISHIYFKTIVVDNLHLFRKWRGSSPRLYTHWRGWEEGSYINISFYFF